MAVCTAATALTASGPAVAVPAGVDATGLFQLEPTIPAPPAVRGSPAPGTTCDPNAVKVNPAGCPAYVTGDDFANVYNKSISSGTPDNATASTFVDNSAGTAIFTGGASKDGCDILATATTPCSGSWSWTSGKPQDKDDIEHAYAALYVAATSYLYFGMDRFANVGDAALGFWFLKGNVAPVAGGKFSGQHLNGDLLVQIDYTNGGATETVVVSDWENGALNTLVAPTTTALCGNSVGATFCASTNLQNETSPWPMMNKAGGGTTTLPAFSYFKGGINLSSFGLDKGCFTTFLAETRSSQPFTSTLSDFAAGQFAPCKASEATTPSTTGSVSPGTAVNDTATITGTGLASPPFPSSATNQVKFYLCGPMPTGTCSSTTNLIGSSALTPTAVQGVSTAQSPDVNTAASPLVPGRYCWLATWAGDSNYTLPITAETNPAAECFTVRQIPTTTVTTPQDANGASFTGNQALGTTIFDHALVSATGSGGGAITGAVTFTLCNPDQLVGGVCPDGAGTQVGSPVTVTAVASTPPTATAQSLGTAANEAGTWCFRAVFVPTGSTYTGSADNGDSAECVVINPAPTTTVTTPTDANGGTLTMTSFVPVGTVVHDHVVVSSPNPAAGAPTGSVQFFLCDPTQLDINGLCSAGGHDLGSVGLTTSGLTGVADSGTFTVNAVGTWCFRGVYTSNTNNYTGSSDSTIDECFTVKDTTAASSAQNWLPNDSATITSTDPNTVVSGTITITLYAAADCNGAVVPNQSYTSTTLSGTHTITFATSNTTYFVTANAAVSWKVAFTSSNENLVGSSSHCENTSLTITN